MKPILVTMIFLLAAPSFAYWDCPKGQPQQCINEVEGYNRFFNQNIKYYQDQIAGSSFKIKTCWNNHTVAQENERQLEIKIAENDGMLKVVTQNRNFLKALFEKQQLQRQLLGEFQAQFHALFRELVFALEGTLANNSIEQLMVLKNGLLKRLGEANLEDKKILNVTIMIIDEIINSIQSSNSSEKNVLEKLKAILKSQSKMSVLAVEAVSLTVNHQTVSNMDLNELLAQSLIVLNSVIDDLNYKLQESETEIKSLTQSLEVLRGQKRHEGIMISTYKTECAKLEVFLTQTAPANLASDKQKLESNINFLNSHGCEHKHCVWERYVDGSDKKP